MCAFMVAGTDKRTAAEAELDLGLSETKPSEWDKSSDEGELTAPKKTNKRQQKYRVVTG